VFLAAARAQSVRVAVLDIAVVIEEVNLRGGQERVALELIRRWAERHRVTLYCYAAAADLLPAEVRLVRLPRPGPSKLFGAVLFPWLSAARVARRHQIVLAHGGNCLRANFVLFHTCHALRLESLRRIAGERGRPPSARERLNMAVRRRVFIPLERRTVQRCPGRSYAVSERLRLDLVRVHGVAGDSVRVAPNGVDGAVFHPGVRRQRPEARCRLGLDERELVALFIGGLWWEKGLHIALEALARVRQPWKLLVAGQDDDAPAFQALAGRLGVARRVQFLGFVDRPQRLYAAADCLMLPSGFEGFPLVALEAAACGLPVLISREAHPGELFDETTGYVLPRTAEAFAQALDELAADPRRRQAMQTAAAARARGYTWDRQAAILEEGFWAYVRGRG
jgi:glycosyltransferase involved in cell wall biosynthesis